MKNEIRYWLLKSEPDCFSIQDLAAAPKKTTYWDGVRNYQARNFMRDDMQRGDRVLFYHSGSGTPATEPAIAGTATIVREAYPDFTALDPDSDHYDAKQSKENPIWQMVDIQLDEIFAQPLPLALLRTCGALAQMELLKRGSRLSVQPVRPAEFAAVLALEKSQAAAEKTPARAASKKPLALKKKRPAQR